MPDTRPTLGALGLGWIGRHRLQAVADSGLADIVAVADPSPNALEETADFAPDAARCPGIDELMGHDLDGVLVATPSAMHARQARRLLEAGIAVFCQKPLGRDAPETRRVVEAARQADRLLGVDFSYRHVAGIPEVRRLIADGELGEVFTADLVFHNAYGPDKEWFYDPERSGGGCVVDLGIHLVDMALWMLDFPEVISVDSQCYAGGRPLEAVDGEVEDYAVARIALADGTTVRLTCSWCLNAGRDAIIGAEFYGSEGGAALRNVDGSFYDFVVERYRGTQAERLASPPDAWGGRAAVDWVRRLADDTGYDPRVASAVDVARVLDGIYGRRPPGGPEAVPRASERASSSTT